MSTKFKVTQCYSNLSNCKVEVTQYLSELIHSTGEAPSVNEVGKQEVRHF